MSMGGGSSGGGGGAVVSQTAPWAASLAGQYQSAAAQAAASAATNQTNMAINSIRDAYTGSVQALKPYTSEGIQALGQLNQYMGLQAYNPGTAPTTPTKKVAADFYDQISRSDLRNYVNLNTDVVSVSNRMGQPFSHLQYNGAGSEDPNLQSLFAQGWQNTPNGEQNPGGLTSAGSNDRGGSLSNAWSIFGNLPGIQDAIRNELGGDMANKENYGFQSKMDLYNQQKDLYDYAKTLQQQYDAAGPLTPDQVAAKLASTPGYQFQLGQGIDAIQRAASAKGMLGSGRLLQALSDYGQGMASQTYGETLSRLASLVSLGANAAGQVAQGSNQMGQQIGGAQIQLGDTLANSFLASGNAKAQALIAANPQYSVIGGQGGGGGGAAGIGSVLGGLGSLASGMSGLFSSKQLKDKLDTPSKEEILARVKELDIDRWVYKDTQVSHIGPYAEDFKEKFGVGDGQSINLIDVIGVLLSSVQALSAKIDVLTKCAGKTTSSQEVH